MPPEKYPIYLPKKIKSLSGVLLALFLPLAIIASLTIQNIRQNAQNTSSMPMHLISRGAPATASYGIASAANDNTYDTAWETNGSSWLAYDLSAVEATKKQTVTLVWYNNKTYAYNYSLVKNGNQDNAGLPVNYTIEINSAPGGSVPTTNWQTATTITNNLYHSRQHVISLAGINWIRINITGENAISLNMDIYNTNTSNDDNFIFYGDSISAGAMTQTTINGTAAINQLINTRIPEKYPIVENGGIGGLLSSDGAQHIKEWLYIFPGKYVGLAFGTNDGWTCENTESISTSVYNNHETMVKEIIATGKIPVIAGVIWSSKASIQQCAKAINAKLNQLSTTYPQVIKGPDLFTTFENHPEYFYDGIHTNDQGSSVYRQAWTNAIINNIYSKTTTPISTVPIISTSPDTNSPFVSPDFECIGGMNCVPSQTPSIPIKTSPPPQLTTTNPLPSTIPTDPCANTSQAVTSNQQVMRHKRHSINNNNNGINNSTGLIKQLLEFFLQLINLILELIGKSPIPTPPPSTPTPQPTPCEPGITTQPPALTTNMPLPSTQPIPSTTIPGITTPPANNATNPASPFRTLAAGSPLPSDEQCAAAVKKVPEVIQENTNANNTKGIPVNGTYLSTAINARDIEARITGNFTGTTDEILQWGACKWGFDEDNVRAQAKQESSWSQAQVGDGGASLGILQVRGNDGTFPGTMPYIQTSTAFNVDYALAVRRACFEGKESWLASKNPSYASGDEWGCIGRWFSGDWHDPAAEDYISLLEGHLSTKNWPKP